MSADAFYRGARQRSGLALHRGPWCAAFLSCWNCMAQARRPV